MGARTQAGDTEAVEKYSKQTVRVDRRHNDECKQLLRLMGVPVVESPGEAEAQCSSLCSEGLVRAAAGLLLPFDLAWLASAAPRRAPTSPHSVPVRWQVYGIATEDMDSLTFGCPRLVRHLMAPASQKVSVMEFDYSKVRSRQSGSISTAPSARRLAPHLLRWLAGQPAPSSL